MREISEAGCRGVDAGTKPAVTSQAMTRFARLPREFRALSRTLFPRDLIAYLASVAWHAPEIIRAGTLMPADRSMTWDITITYRGAVLHLPLNALDRDLAGTGDTASFGAVREMFAHDVYLRWHDLLGPLHTVIDLGANRGFFMLIAAKVFARIEDYRPRSNSAVHSFV
jgi:hypothetical protein